MAGIDDVLADPETQEALSEFDFLVSESGEGAGEARSHGDGPEWGNEKTCSHSYIVFVFLVLVLEMSAVNCCCILLFFSFSTFSEHVVFRELVSRKKLLRHILNIPKEK